MVVFGKEDMISMLAEVRERLERALRKKGVPFTYASAGRDFRTGAVEAVAGIRKEGKGTMSDCVARAFFAPDGTLLRVVRSGNGNYISDREWRAIGRAMR
jgi:hypothetical protein